MSKKDLKQQNKDLDFSIIDILSDIDPSETNKFTPFILKMLRKEMTKHPLRRLRSTGKNPSNLIEANTIAFIIELMGKSNIDAVKSFHEHLLNNRIPENKRDINQYNDWLDLEKEVSLADLRKNQKSLEKHIIRVFENDEWVAIKPLSLESSLAYGSGTKWCTAMKNNSDYFYRYSRNGVLTYIINKNNGDKYGAFFDHNAGEFSLWNAPDRRIDSVESTIPSDLMKLIYKNALEDKCNFEYFSEEEKRKINDGPKKMSIGEAEVAIRFQNHTVDIVAEPNYEILEEAPRDIEPGLYQYQEDPVVDMSIDDMEVEMMYNEESCDEESWGESEAPLGEREY